jgi:hypothetical protein
LFSTEVADFSVVTLITFKNSKLLRHLGRSTHVWIVNVVITKKSHLLIIEYLECSDIFGNILSTTNSS